MQYHQTRKVRKFWLSLLAVFTTITIVAFYQRSGRASASSEWTVIDNISSPGPRFAHGLAYDEGREKLVLFGGEISPSCGQTASDTWEYDGSGWTRVLINGPSNRVDPGMAYDINRGRVVLFGGAQYSQPKFGDTWEYDGNNWIRIFPATSPPGRATMAIAYDPIREKVVIFGGWTGTQIGNDILGDTWEFDGVDWVQVFTPNSPAPRAGARMVFDEQLGKIVMFGGNMIDAVPPGPDGRTDQTTNETWIYDGQDWVEIQTANKPPERFYHQMSYDPLTGKVILFGGNTRRTGELNDTWEFNGVNWYQVSPVNEPPITWGGAMSYYPPQAGTVLFGGNSPEQCNITDATWIYYSAPLNTPPVSDAGGPYVVNEGEEILLNGSDSSDPDGDALTYLWDLNYDGVFETSGESPIFDGFDIDGPSLVTITLQVCDPASACRTDMSAITIDNVSPTAVFSNTSGNVNEGASAQLSFSAVFDPGVSDTVAGFGYSFDCESDGQFDQVGLTNTYLCGYLEDGVFTVTGRVEDKDGGFTEYTAGVVVDNQAPVIGPIIAPLYPVLVSTTITATAVFTDPGILDVHNGTWDWGDNTGTSALLVETNGSGTVSGSHTYTEPGVYEVVLSVVDDEGAYSQENFQYIVVYDPIGGFTTGAGWFWSEAGWCQYDNLCSLAEGRASFGFVSKYQQGAVVPTGNTQFKFKAGDFEFDSVEYEWLVINQGGTNAQFKGTGTINNDLAPNGEEYHFMIWAKDGSPDTFRIKIWWEDAAGNEVVVYENGIGQPIGAGNIKVHNGN